MRKNRQDKSEAGQTNALSPEEKKRLGLVLKNFRESRHMNQEELAGIIGCTGQYVSDVERGKYSLSLKKYMTICDHFGVPADELIFGKRDDYSEFDVRSRIIKQMDGLNVEQIGLLEDQIRLARKMFNLT